MGEVQRQHYVTQIVTDCFFPALQIWGQHQLYEGLGSNLTPPRAAEDPDTHPRGSQLFLASLICPETAISPGVASRVLVGLGEIGPGNAAWPDPNYSQWKGLRCSWIAAAVFVFVTESHPFLFCFEHS